MGGHCLPVDPSYLAWRVERRLGHRFRFVELANEVNGGMPDYVVRRAQALLNDNGRAVNGSRILLDRPRVQGRHLRLAGVAGDDRRPAALPSSAPRCAPTTPMSPTPPGLGPEVERVDCTVEELEAADLVVVLTAHEDLPYDQIADHARLVLDTRGSLRGRSFRGQVL